ncbi:MAG TPA: bifunctional riboflavin kinase/FAD synthetase [Clostridia bacterium]|nr:bifunctional riboflavin kinase/FAD synthetase [Clostridia bacterium]
MDVIYDFPDFENPTVICLGNFDGVHKGHQYLIKKTVKYARDLGLPSVVLTFEPHPELILYPEKRLKRILTNELKTELIAKLGVDILVYLPFSIKVANMSPEDFIRNILSHHLKAAHIFTGFNYTFGNGAAGTVSTLQEFSNTLGYQFYVIPPFHVNDHIVSSSLIRSYLVQGKIEEAKEMLGYWPLIRGKVVQGDQRGRVIGFPTANIEIDSELLTPANGVYASLVYYKDKRFWGMTNIGIKPTIGTNLPKTIEVNIFDFADIVYNEHLTIQLIKFIRPEMKFLTLDKLKEQLLKDKREIRNYLQQTCQ